jgi:hypothetical protein
MLQLVHQPDEREGKQANRNAHQSAKNAEAGKTSDRR